LALSSVAIGVQPATSVLDLRRVLAAGFPSSDLVPAAAGLLAGCPSRSSGSLIAEGPSFFLEVTPGTVALAAHDLARAERSHNRRQDSQVVPPSEGDSTREVRVWSAKSRARMIRAYASLDYSPLFQGIPGMVTLTYPGDWESLTPTGAHLKAHLKAFRKRWARRWGRPPVGLWKLEFQRRGAPHVHLFVSLPFVPLGEFCDWLSLAWYEVVGSGDLRHLMAGTGVDLREAARMRDPRRVAVYFSGHSLKSGDGKEYQHAVPELWTAPGAGPGRFWGYWGLSVASAVVELDPRTFILVRRLLRRWAKASSRRTVMASGRLAGGWVTANDGPALVSSVARYLALCT